MAAQESWLVIRPYHPSNQSHRRYVCAVSHATLMLPRAPHAQVQHTYQLVSNFMCQCCTTVSQATVNKRASTQARQGLLVDEHPTTCVCMSPSVNQAGRHQPAYGYSRHPHAMNGPAQTVATGLPAAVALYSLLQLLAMQKTDCNVARLNSSDVHTNPLLFKYSCTSEWMVSNELASPVILQCCSRCLSGLYAQLCWQE